MKNALAALFFVLLALTACKESVINLEFYPSSESETKIPSFLILDSSNNRTFTVKYLMLDLYNVTEELQLIDDGISYLSLETESISSWQYSHNRIIIKDLAQNCQLSSYMSQDTLIKYHTYFENDPYHEDGEIKCTIVKPFDPNHTIPDSAIVSITTSSTMTPRPFSLGDTINFTDEYLQAEEYILRKNSSNTQINENPYYCFLNYSSSGEWPNTTEDDESKFILFKINKLEATYFGWIEIPQFSSSSLSIGRVGYYRLEN